METPVINEETINLFQEAYEKERERLFKQLVHFMVNNNREGERSTAELLNTMESANRIFLHFADTGTVSTDALDR